MKSIVVLSLMRPGVAYAYERRLGDIGGIETLLLQFHSKDPKNI